MDTVTIGFICYLVIIIIVGFYTARVTKNLKDFAQILPSSRKGPPLRCSSILSSDPLFHFFLKGKLANSRDFQGIFKGLFKIFHEKNTRENEFIHK